MEALRVVGGLASLLTLLQADLKKSVRVNID